MTAPVPDLALSPAPAVSTIALLAVAGFASLASMRLCDAMLPALAVAFSTSTTEAASVVASFALAYGLMQLVYGPLGDRFGKPRVIACATAWCALAALAASMATSLDVLVAARVAMGAGAAAIVPLALAWIGDTVPLAQRQVVLARYSGASLSGIMVGAWAGGFITDGFGWRGAFVALVPLFLGIALLLGRRSGAEFGASPPPQESYRVRLTAMLSAPWARLVLATVFFEGLFGFGFLALLPTVLHARFGLPLTQAGAALALFAFGGVAFSRMAGFVLARVTPPVQVRAGGALLAMGYLALAAMPHWSWAFVACPVAGLGFYMFHNPLQVQATQLSTSSRGLGVSMFGCFLFLGQSVGVALAAWVFTRLHPAWGFVAAGSGLLGVSLVFAHRLGRRAQYATSSA